MGYCVPSCGETAFKSKAGAISFAIMMSSSFGDNGTRKVDYDEALKLYDFILEHVDLPDVDHDSYSELLSSLAGLASARAMEGCCLNKIEEE